MGAQLSWIYLCKFDHSGHSPESTIRWGVPNFMLDRGDWRTLFEAEAKPRLSFLRTVHGFVRILLINCTVIEVGELLVRIMGYSMIQAKEATPWIEWHF